MFQKKQSFLALDIGTNSVRGFGMFFFAGTVKSHLHTETGKNLSENIARAVDAIEGALGVKFKDVFVTGNFGLVEYTQIKNTVAFGRIRKITDTDIRNAIFNSPRLKELSDRTTLHLIPLQFLIDGETEVRGTDGISCRSLGVRAAAISYPTDAISAVKKGLWAACFGANNFFDPIYLLGRAYFDGKKPSLFIDFGKTLTKIGLYKARGLVTRFDLETGQDAVTQKLSADFNISYADAEDIKLSVLTEVSKPSDQYVLASPKHPTLTRANVFDAWFEANSEIVERVLEKIQDENFDVFITGGGINPDNIKALILKNKGFEDITVLDEYAAVGAFGKIFAKKAPPMRKKPTTRIKPRGAIPILPGIRGWDIGSRHVYELFEEIGIRAVHLDMQDGFYTTTVSGTLEDLETIRANTKMKIQAHLMVADPMTWIPLVAKAGADVIVVSSGSGDIVAALKKIKELRKKCGLAIDPDYSLRKLSPQLLTMLDEIIVMSVVPGPAAQGFMPSAIGRIKTLYNTRKKYDFKYKLLVDGGINDETAPECWKAGADMLISQNYLRKAPDFADALSKLLPRK